MVVGLFSSLGLMGLGAMAMAGFYKRGFTQAAR